MSRCYWCGSFASKKVNMAFICDRHHQEFIDCFVKKPSQDLVLVKSSTTSTHSLQAHENLKNIPIALQQFVDEERACG